MIHSPFDPDRSLSDAQKSEEPHRPRPETIDTTGAPDPGYRIHPAARFFVRGPWEMVASILIGVGVIMLMQPFWMTAYSYSFFVTLVGTVMFIIVSHFPE